MEHATDATFDKEVTNAKGPVFVDFWAEWCGPCRRYGPLFEEFSKENEGKAKFVKVNVEEAQDVASKFGVQSIPTTIIFKNGEEAAREVGILSKDMLQSMLASSQ